MSNRGQFGTYCRGKPCKVHKLHRFTILVPEEGETEANGYVVACSQAHAEEAAAIEGGEGTTVISEEEGMDEDRLAYCPICPDEDEDDDE